MSSNINLSTQKRLPYIYYYLVIFFLILIGICDTAYLVFSHYKNYTEISYSSFCAISQAINCDTVSQSPWSIFIGLPLAIWGLVGYIILLILIIPLKIQSSFRISLWSLIVLLSFCYSSAAIYLGYISAIKIKSYCILCLISYLISFMILFGSWIVCRRFFQQPFRQHFVMALRYINNSLPLKSCLISLFFIAYCMILFLPKYWLYIPSNQSAKLPTGISETGSPWIGAKKPLLTIEEYSDYQCFQCAKMHSVLRKLISEYPDSIRLVHHHYPMDHEFNPIVVPAPFHVGSGKMALLAIYAQFQGKFWEANDILFRLGREKKSFNTKDIAEELHLLTSDFVTILDLPEIRAVLNSDILRGMKLRIMATPSFVIEGKVYTGAIPPEILAPYIKK